MSAEDGREVGGGETSKEENEASSQPEKTKLEDMQEADEVYERIKELDNEIEETESFFNNMDFQVRN